MCRRLLMLFLHITAPTTVGAMSSSSSSHHSDDIMLPLVEPEAGNQHAALLSVVHPVANRLSAFV